jgi:YidC/Oxa1 family membrane protein insertase
MKKAAARWAARFENDRKYPLPEISNPNLQSQGPGGGGGGGDMRSTLLFTMLILAVLLGYQYFMKPSPQQTQQNQTQNQTQNSQQSHTAAQTQTPAQVTAAPGQSVAAAPAIQAALETQTTVENPVFKIVFTNRGAQVKHWILKAYKDSDGKPLDMVQPQVAAKAGYPLSLFTYEPALTDQLNQALYQVTVEGAQPTATGEVQAPAALVFHYQANGLDVVKTFRFDKSYVVGVETRVMRNGSPVRALVEWPGGLGDMEEFLPSSANRSPVRTSASSMFAWSQNGKQDSLAAHKVSGYATLNEAYSYAAIADLYFATAFLPENPEQTTVVTLHNTIDLPSDLSDANSKKTPADVIERHDEAAAVCRSEGNRTSVFDPRDWRGRQADGAVAGPADPAWLAHGHCQAAVSGAALLLRARRSELGLGDHYRYGAFQSGAALYAHLDDEVVAEDDAHPAEG